MKRPADFYLLHELVLVDILDGEQPLTGKIFSVSPESNLVYVEFMDGSKGQYQKEEVLHLYPKAIILQGLISNFEMSRENFKTILNVTRLISQKRNVEALQLAVSNELVKFFCITDCKSWLALQEEAQKKKNGIKFKKK